MAKPEDLDAAYAEAVRIEARMEATILPDSRTRRVREYNNDYYSARSNQYREYNAAPRGYNNDYRGPRNDEYNNDGRRNNYRLYDHEGRQDRLMVVYIIMIKLREITEAIIAKVIAQVNTEAEVIRITITIEIKETIDGCMILMHP